MKEICKLAREKGFKAKTVTTKVTLDYQGKSSRLINETCNYLLLCEIQKWLREEFNIEVIPYPVQLEQNKKEIPQTESIDYHYYYFKDVIKQFVTGNSFNSYEEALMAGIKETLENL